MVQAWKVLVLHRPVLPHRQVTTRVEDIVGVFTPVTVTVRKSAWLKKGEIASEKIPFIRLVPWISSCQ
uniref:Uncharacterized protein n=1 Tax=Daphnia galeata TaxID=27404 RepID=A0A8J2RBB9_9CRUS|nr:unnamed protein product [Daphnia galeata]